MADKPTTFIVSKPDNSKFVYTSNKDPQFLYTLKNHFPGMNVRTDSNAVPGYIWSDPKAHGWEVETIREETLVEDGEATTTSDVAVVPKRLRKIPRRKMTNEDESTNIDVKDLEYGTFIRLKPDAEPSLSYSSKSVPKKWIKDGGLWAVDGVEESMPGEYIININRVMDPYPGAYCSFITPEEIAEIVPTSKQYRQSQRLRSCPTEDILTKIDKILK